MVGENGTRIIVVSAVSHSWTWHLYVFVSGWGYLISFVHLPPWVWVILFDLSSSLCFFTMISDPLMSNTAKLIVVPPYVQENLTSASINLPLILIWSWSTKTLCSSVSRRWCGKNYGPPSIKVISYRIQLFIREANLETPFQYLGACTPQWQVLRIRRKVFIIGLWSNDFAGVRCQITIKIPWIMPIVPWGPSSLLVVPLTSVNNFHYWLVIRRCSCMFDFSSHIHMLELVLCSDWDGAQDHGFCLIYI